MSKKLLSTLIASLFVAAPAFAQSDDFKAEGSVTIGGLYNDIDTKDKAKANEYQDLSNGVPSMFEIRGRGGMNWIEGYAENVGRDDQYLMARGGIYGLFKAKIYSDSMPHNFLFNGLTPFQGAGSGLLTSTFPQPNPATWAPVDIGYQRRDNGGFFEWQGYSPWYARVDANEVKFDGTKIGSGSNGTSPGNGYSDLVIPAQYVTRNVVVEGGYNTGALNVSASWMHSTFDNNYRTLLWTNPFFGNNLDTTYLAPDNEYDRFQLNGTLRSLPLNSTLAARYTWSETTSDATLGTSVLNGTGANAYVPSLPTEDTFHGKVRNQTFNLSWAAAPMKGLDTKVYYTYSQRDNKGTRIEYENTAIGCGGAPCENELFGYDKNEFAAEAYWRFLPGQRLSGGWQYIDANYDDRPDYSGATWNRFFVEYKNTMLENVSARLKYIYMQRRGDYTEGSAGLNANDPNYLLRFTSAYDLSDLNRNELRLSVDWAAAPLFDVSFEGIWKDNDYDVTLGRQSDRRYELYGMLAYGDPKRFRVALFGDYEHVKYDSSHRYIGAGSCPTTSGGVTANNCFDVNTPPNSIAYNWTSQNKDTNWVVGVGADWPVNELLMVKASYLYYETDGSADFQSENNYGNPLPLTNWDDSKRTSFNLKGIYQINKNWSATLGYAYEKWSYSDQGFSNGFQYTIPFPGVTNNASQSYLNGYMANPNYTSNIVYLLGTFKF